MARPVRCSAPGRRTRPDRRGAPRRRRTPAPVAEPFQHGVRRLQTPVAGEFSTSARARSRSASARVIGWSSRSGTTSTRSALGIEREAGFGCRRDEVEVDARPSTTTTAPSVVAHGEVAVDACPGVAAAARRRGGRSPTRVGSLRIVHRNHRSGRAGSADGRGAPAGACPGRVTTRRQCGFAAAGRRAPSR